MHKRQIITLLIVIGVVLATAGGYYLYQSRQDSRFKAVFGAPESELRTQLMERARSFDIYLKNTTSESDALKIVATLKTQSWAELVEYTSSEQSLANFKEKHANDPTIDLALKELETNPLLAGIQVRVKECSQISQAEQFINANVNLEFVSTLLTPKIACDEIDKMIETKSNYIR